MADYGRAPTVPRTPAHSVPPVDERDVRERPGSRHGQIDDRWPYRPEEYEGDSADGDSAYGDSAYVSTPRVVPAVARQGSPGFAATAPSAIALLGGVWLIVARFVYTFLGTGGRLGGVPNGIVVGAAVVLIALAQLSNPASSPALSAANVVLGGWMIASPWVFHYHFWSALAWSDLITGVVIGLTALASFSAGAARNSGEAVRNR
ncbi:MAG TPA: SPW repeat protein [Rugosimonospora sp.]|nr:SPW repeat protein [Rugosimonospora sp.]